MRPLINMHQPISAVVDSGLNKHAVGDEIVYGEARYVYAYNGSNSAITAGKLCELISGASGHSVVASGTSASRPVGICVHQTVATGQYFWMLKEGVCEKAILTGPTAASQAYLYPGGSQMLTTTQPTGLNTALGANTWVGAYARAMEEIASATAGGTGRIYVLPV